jgi:Rod binding domain-containing protein
MDFPLPTRATEAAAALARSSGGADARADLERRLAGAPAEKIAREFESLLAMQLVREARNTLPEGFFGSGAGADTYGAWLDEHVGRAIAESGALDLAGVIRVALAPALGAAADASTEPNGGAA